MLLAEDPERRPRPEAFLWISGVAVSAALGALIALAPLERAGALPLVVALVAALSILCLGRPRALIALAAIVYFGAVQYAYVDFVVPLYSYHGNISVRPDWPALLVVMVLAVSPAAWLPTALRRASDVVVWFLYLFGYVPAIAIPIHLLGPDLETTLPFMGLVAVAFATLGLTRRIPIVPTRWRGLSERDFSLLLLASSLGGAAYLIAVFGIPSGIPAFEDVYDARASYAAVSDTAVGAGYIVPWVGSVVFPFLVALGLARSRYAFVLVGIAGELLVYGTTGFKTVLFSILLVPFLFVAIRYASRGLGTLLVWSGGAVVMLSLAATMVTGSIWPLALFVTRLVAVPGQMTAYFYDFFSHNETYALSRSFLRFFIEAPYDVDPPYLIGTFYLDNPAISANANLWADAMANFGLLGIVPFTLVLGGVLWLLDSVAAGRDIRIIGPTLGLAGISLANAGLFTSFLTLGIGLTIALIALMPKLAGASSETRVTPRAR